MENRGFYYYSKGNRIELIPADECTVIELENVIKNKHLDKRLGLILKKARELKRNLYFVDKSELDQDNLDYLNESVTQHPVFKHNNTLIVVLPEVRVELSPGENRYYFKKFMKSSPVPAEIVKDRGDMFVLRPKSGLGLDALLLANQLYEEANVEFAQARFLRIVPRPSIEHHYVNLKNKAES